jgi:integrase
MSVVDGKISYEKERTRNMAVRKRRDTKKGSWQAGWRAPDGKWRTRDFPTKAQAKHFEAQMKADVQQGDYKNPKSAKIKVESVFPNWRKASTSLKPKTLDSYDSLWRCLVKPKWGDKGIGQITRAEVKVWAQEAISSSENRISVSRIRQAVVLLNLLLNHAVDMDLIKRNPIGSPKGLTPRLEERKPKRALEKEELLKLANSCGPYRLMVLLAGLTGLRWGEVIALKPADFDFKTKTIRVNKSLSEVNGNFHLVSTKTGKDRTLPIPEFLSKELKSLVLSTPEENEVFLTKNGKRLRKSNFARETFKPAVIASNLDGVRFHDLRHTAVSLQVNAGADILAISRVAGHTKPSTTLNVYAHELDSSTDSIRAVMDNILAESEFDKYSTDSKIQSA